MEFRVGNDSRNGWKGFGIKKTTSELIPLALPGFWAVGGQRLFELKTSLRNHLKTETALRPSTAFCFGPETVIWVAGCLDAMVWGKKKRVCVVV